jgi:hypothetical protein
MHTNYEEMMAHVTKWKSKAKQHDNKSNLIKLLKGETLSIDDKAQANLDLYCIIVDGTGSQDLLRLLGGIEYEDQGKKALDYIQNFWGKKADSNKAESWHSQYQTIANEKYTTALTPFEFARIRTEMVDLRARLAGTDYAISTARLATDMKKMIMSINDKYESTVEFEMMKSFGTSYNTMSKDPAQVGEVLEGVVSKLQPKYATTAAGIAHLDAMEQPLVLDEMVFVPSSALRVRVQVGELVIGDLHLRDMNQRRRQINRRLLDADHLHRWPFAILVPSVRLDHARTFLDTILDGLRQLVEPGWLAPRSQHVGMAIRRSAGMPNTTCIAVLKCVVLSAAFANLVTEERLAQFQQLRVLGLLGQMKHLDNLKAFARIVRDRCGVHLVLAPRRSGSVLGLQL